MTLDIWLRLTLFLLAAGQLGLAMKLWTRRSRDVSFRSFTGLLVASALFTAGLGLRLIAESGVTGLLLIYLGLFWLPGCWLLLVLRQTGRIWPARLEWSLGVGVPLLFSGFLLTHPWHQGLYFGVGANADFRVGPILVFFRMALHGAVLLALFLLLDGVLRSEGFQRRRQAALAAASLGVWGLVLGHESGLGGLRLEWVAVALGTLLLAFGLAILHLRFFDLRPLAREQVFMGMRDAVVVAGSFDEVVDFNPAAQALFPDLRRGMAVREAFGPWPELIRALLGEAALGRFTLPTEVGLRRFRVNVFPVPGRGGEGGQALVLADHTEVHRAMEELRALATTDPLTGASNRRHFQERLEQAFQRSERHRVPVALVAVDLDHFKGVNDTLGHAAGDAVLQVAVARLYVCLREVDALGRLGGEEFAVLLEGSSLEGARQVAERMRLSLARTPVEWRGQSIPVTASFGVAFHPGGPGGDPLELLREADLALYRAKRDGRNRVE